MSSPRTAAEANLGCARAWGVETLYRLSCPERYADPEKVKNPARMAATFAAYYLKDIAQDAVGFPRLHECRVCGDLHDGASGRDYCCERCVRLRYIDD